MDRCACCDEAPRLPTNTFCGPCLAEYEAAQAHYTPAWRAHMWETADAISAFCAELVAQRQPLDARKAQAHGQRERDLDAQIWRIEQRRERLIWLRINYLSQCPLIWREQKAA